MRTVARTILTLTAQILLLGFAASASAQIYNYDSLGRIQSVSYPSGGAISYSYDLNSNITSISHTGVAAPLAPDGIIDTPDQDVVIDAGQSVNFTGTGGDPDGAFPLSYHWDFDDGAADSNDEDPGQTVFNDAGIYTVTFTVTDATGISDAIPDTVKVTVQAVANPPPVNNPPPQTIKQTGGGGSVLWLPLMLFLISVRRLLCRSLVPLFLAFSVHAVEWAPMNSTTTENLRDVWGASPEAVYAVGDNGTVLFFDGEAWTELDLGVNARLRSVWGRSANDVYVVGDSDTFMHYDGQNWTSVDFPDSGFHFVDIWSAGPGERLWVIATQGAWYFDGNTWTREGFTDFLSRSFTPNAQLTGIGGTADTVVVTSVPISSTFFGLYVNFDDSADFRAHAVHAFNDNEMFVVGESNRRLDGGLARTARDWRQIGISDGMQDVWGTSPSDMFAVGSLTKFNDTGAIYHYDGNVDNIWERMITLQSTRFTGVWGFGPTDVMAVGERGTIMRYFAPPPPATAANFPYSAMATGSVNAYTGELVRVERDIDVGHLTPVRFERYYASGILNDTRIGGQLGRNWTHNFEWKLLENDADGTPEINVLTPRGRHISFRKPAAEWELVAPLSTAFLLTETEFEFLFADPVDEKVYRFNKTFHELTSIEDRNGNRVWLNYNQGVLVSIDDRKGNEVVFDYADVNRLGGVHTIGTATTPTPQLNYRFEYTNGNLTSVTDPSNQVTTYEYEAARENDALLTAVHLPLTTERMWTYDESRQVVREQVVEGGEILISHGDRTATITNPDGTTRSYTHNGDGAMESFADEANQTMRYEYDNDGRPSVLVDRIGRQYGWAYHVDSGKVQTISRPDQLSYSMTYQENSSNAGIPFFDVVRIDYPDQTAVSMQYDPFGNMTSYTDQDNKIWAYTHTERGEVETATNPIFGVTTYQYRSHGGLQSVLDHAGNRTRIRYDGYQRLTAVEHPDNTLRSFVWNDSNDVEQLTTELGEVYDYAYNEDGRLIRITNSSGEEIQLGYNGRGDVIQLSRPGDNGDIVTSSLTHDALGRIESLTRPDLTEFDFGYDPIGQLETVTDGKNETWTVERDSEGTVKRFDFPGDDEVAFDNTDNALRLNSAVAAGNEKLNARFDPMGRVGFTLDAMESPTTISRDSRGLVTSVSSSEPGVVTKFERNDLGQVTKKTDPEGGEWKSNYDSQGRVVSEIDPLNKMTTIGYDNRNRVRILRFADGAGDLTIDYNGANQATKKSYSDGTVIEMDYDTQMRPRSGDGVALDFDNRGNMNDSNGLVIKYDNNDRIERITLAQGRFIEYRYDSRGNLERVTDWLGGETVIGRTMRGQPESIELPNGVVNGYGYDRAGRIVDISYGAIGSISLQRDVRGFLKSANRNLPGPQTIETEQRLFEFDLASQVTRFNYDVVGNLRQSDAGNFNFNLASQMTGYTGKNGQVTVAYDALGNPIETNSAAGNRAFVWNYAFGKQRIAVEQAAGQDLWYYVYTTSGRLLYRINGDGIRHHYHYDENGNTVFITDNAGNVVKTYFYSPLGEVLDESGNLDNDRKFAAEFGGFQMDDTDINLFEGQLIDLKNGVQLSRPEPADFQIFEYGNDVLTDKARSANNELNPYVEMGMDLVLNAVGSLPAAGEKVLEVQPLTGSVNGIPSNTAAKATLRFVGKVLAPVGGGWAAAKEHRKDVYRSEAGRNAGAISVGVANTAAGLYPPTAVTELVVSIADIPVTAVTGDKTGVSDVMPWNSVSRNFGAVVDATWGGEGWQALQRRANHVRHEEGWSGWALTGLTDYVIGPALGEWYNVMSLETFRTSQLEDERLKLNKGIVRVQ